jgi:hypothetical protein
MDSETSIDDGGRAEQSKTGRALCCKQASAVFFYPTFVNGICNDSGVSSAFFWVVAPLRVDCLLCLQLPHLGLAPSYISSLIYTLEAISCPRPLI